MYSNKPFLNHIEHTGLRLFVEEMHRKSPALYSDANHGDFHLWAAGLEEIHRLLPPQKLEISKDLNSGSIKIGTPDILPGNVRTSYKQALMRFHPWRKGPYNLFGIEIDCEWRSDKKWDRLAEKISPLKGRTVLDIGCGNGYHCWRMLGAGAKAVLGIDPMLLYAMQFQLFHSYLPLEPIEFIPVGLESLPQKMNAFDTVFSMGVLYHRRSPLDHLLRLRDLMKPGGEMVLETLVVDGPDGYSLLPAGRYARMRNVWFLPSTLTLRNWLKRCGYKNIHLLDVGYTTSDEQRATEWMTYDSLYKCLDAQDPKKTVEGYPAPQRAIFSCSL